MKDTENSYLHTQEKITRLTKWMLAIAGMTLSGFYMAHLAGEENTSSLLRKINIEKINHTVAITANIVLWTATYLLNKIHAEDKKLMKRANEANLPPQP